jgi:hypothetical protein
LIFWTTFSAFGGFRAWVFDLFNSTILFWLCSFSVLCIFVEKLKRKDRRQSKIAKHFSSFKSVCEQYRSKSHQCEVQEDTKKWDNVRN